MTTDLTCPKCLSTMRSIDRNGIVIERCESCGAIFLDKNELEQLIRLENDYVEQRVHAESDRRRDRRDRRDDRDRDADFDDWFDDDDRFGRGGGFLENLFRSIS